MWLVFLDQWNGSNIFLDIAPTQHLPALEFSTDASGSLGYGAFFNNLCFQGVWSKQFHAHTEQHSMERAFSRVPRMRGLGPSLVRQTHYTLV